MKTFFFLVGAVAALDCSSESFLMRTPNDGGSRCIYDGRLYQAQWSVNQVPGVDNGWQDLGVCDTVPATPVCWPEYDRKQIYSQANTQVSFNGQNYVNQWYADPGRGPTIDALWLRMHSCGEGSIVPPPTTAPTAAPTTTTTAAPVRTTVPFVPEPTTMPLVPEPTTMPLVPGPTTMPLIPGATTMPLIPGPTTGAAVPPTKATTTIPTTTRPTTPSTNPEVQQRPQGPTGANGECVWPAWEPTKTYPTGFRYWVTHKGAVYPLSYYCDPGREPGVDQCWKPQVATCTGEPPVVKLSAAELASRVDPNGPKYQLILDNWDPTSPSAAELAIDYTGQMTLFSKDERRNLNALRRLETANIESITPLGLSNPPNVQRVQRILPKSKFDELFPVRHPDYTYENLLKGVGAFPAYCQTYEDGRDSDQICIKLLITSFAHNTQEVGGNIPSLKYKDGNHMMDGGIHHHPESDAYFAEGEAVPLWKQALWFLRESGYTEASPTTSPYRYCSPESQFLMMWALNYQCPAGSDYWGRGSKQLSWNYNYGMFSKLFYGDASYLLSNPTLVADTWLNFASGIWFAVTAQSPKPSMLEVLDGSWVPNSVDAAAGITAGFGATINIINGGYECNREPTQQAKNRIEAYKNFATYFGYTIPASEQLDCSAQQSFPQKGAGDLKTYWGNSWSCSFLCEPSSNQSGFLAGLPGDYEACVNYWWRARWVDRDTKTVIGQYGDIGANAKPPV